jgi:hypothetical protein
MVGTARDTGDRHQGPSRAVAHRTEMDRFSEDACRRIEQQNEGAMIMS